MTLTPLSHSQALASQQAITALRPSLAAMCGDDDIMGTCIGRTAVTRLYTHEYSPLLSEYLEVRRRLLVLENRVRALIVDALIDDSDYQSACTWHSALETALPAFPPIQRS